MKQEQRREMRIACLNVYNATEDTHKYLWSFVVGGTVSLDFETVEWFRDRVWLTCEALQIETWGQISDVLAEVCWSRTKVEAHNDLVWSRLWHGSIADL